MHVGEKLLIHCWGGRGRAGVIGACLLVKLYGISAEEALTRVGQAFATRGDGEYQSPQTEEQVEFVKTYCKENL